MIREACWSSSHEITKFKTMVSCPFKHSIFEIVMSSEVSIFSICKSIEIYDRLISEKTDTSSNLLSIKLRNKHVSSIVLSENFEEFGILLFCDSMKSFSSCGILSFFKEDSIVSFGSESDFYSFFYSLFDSISTSTIHLCKKLLI